MPRDFVYVAVCGVVRKIGSSNNPHYRIKALQAYYGRKFVLERYWRVSDGEGQVIETMAHRLLTEAGCRRPRLHGHECYIVSAKRASGAIEKAILDRDMEVVRARTAA